MSKHPSQSTNTSIVKKAKSVEEAVEKALSELGVSKENAIIEILQESSKGIFGIGAKDAEVKVLVKPETSANPEKVLDEKGTKQVKKSVKKQTSSGSRVYNSDAPEENAKKFINDVLTAMGIEATINSVLEEDIVKVELAGDNMGIVIGKRGDTLDSLQYLTSLVVNQNSENYIKISIDTENYRQKRYDALVALSNRLAAKVARTGRKFALEPMNPYERRIIHANLQSNEEVTTFSVGQEPYRKVVIAPKNFSGRPHGYGGKNRNDRRNAQNGCKPQCESENTEESASSATYKADFKPQQHKAEYKNFEEYLAAHSDE